MRRLLLVLFLAVACRATEKSAPLPDDPAVMAKLARPLLGGGQFDLASVAGKPTIVNFWSPG